MELRKFSIQGSILAIMLALSGLFIALVVTNSIFHRSQTETLQRQATIALVHLQTTNILYGMTNTQTNLAQSLQRQKKFRPNVKQHNTKALISSLDEMFYRYFQTSSTLQLEKLLILTKQMQVMTHSSEGISLTANPPICSKLIAKAKQRQGTDQLKPIKATCVYDGRPFQAVLVAIGKLKVMAYLLVVTNPTLHLRHIETAMDMPIRVVYPNSTVAYQSNHWPSATQLTNAYLHSSYRHVNNLGEYAFTVEVAKNQSLFYTHMKTTRNIVIFFTITTAFIALLLSFVLLRKSLNPLRQLQQAAERVIHHEYSPITVSAFHEIAVPISSFNEMLKQVQGTHDRLEEQVQERTHELIIARDNALAANRTKSAFLAVMSHELRTPLNAIIGYSEMLEEEAAETDSMFLADLKKIHSAGYHLLKLINDILDISKVEAGKMELHREEFKFNTLIEEIINAVKPIAEQNGNELKVTSIDIGTIYSDSTRLRQVLFNLLSNAGKFTTKGTITLRIRKINKFDTEQLSIDVIDTGIGMTMDQQVHIFDEFFQVDSSSTRQAGGTGLGLSIARRFVLLLGGTIEIKSVIGEGSTFTVILPISRCKTQYQLAEQNAGPVGIIW